VRVAIGQDAAARLADEASRYMRRPRSYGRLFAEQEAHDGRWPGVAAGTGEEVAALLRPYRAALDSCVVRALPAGDTLGDLTAVAEAAAR